MELDNGRLEYYFPQTGSCPLSCLLQGVYVIYIYIIVLMEKASWLRR